MDNIQLNILPKLALNMIVKNESKIITRLFDSLVGIIDCYCICDTGSTDNTVQLIGEYFAARQIPGRVIVEPFKNFEHNRTFDESGDYVIKNFDIFLSDSEANSAFANVTLGSGKAYIKG